MTLGLGGDELLTQLLLLVLAFVLSAVIGIEREIRLKSAGLRTHILVGVGSAMFTLVSAYGFTALGLPQTDPSRIAAQVVSGIGFVGAGVIFVNRGNVVGLTTAASIWVTAAVGMACAAGLPVLAIAGTLLLLVAASALPAAERLLRRTAGSVLTVQAADTGDVLTRVLDACGASKAHTDVDDVRRTPGREGGALELRVRVRAGAAETQRLVARLAGVDGVRTVRVDRIGE